MNGDEFPNEPAEEIALVRRTNNLLCLTVCVCTIAFSTVPTRFIVVIPFRYLIWVSNSATDKSLPLALSIIAKKYEQKSG
jgi:hypothetical protein